MKKLFVTLLSLLCVAACAFVFAACGGNPDGGLDDGNKPPHTITKVTVDKSTLAMEVDEMEVLAATILPQNATNKKIRWISSDELADTYVVAFDIIQVEGGYSDYDGNNFNENGDVIIGVVAVGAGNTKIAAVSEEIYDVGYISDGNGGFTLDQERLKKINMEVSAILNGEVIDEKINNEIRDRIACCEVTVTEESDKERNGIVYSPNDEHGYDKHYIVKSVDNTLDTPVVIQSEFNGKPVRAIKAEAFKDCSLIPSITIPDSVTRIEQDAFSGCAALTSITIPDSVTYIGEGALSGCTSLTSITMPYVSRLSNIFAENVPASLKTVVITSGYGGYAFKGCSGLTSITLPNGITQIGPQMFADCTSLAEINIPDSVTYIGEDAFSGCTSLASIKVGADNTEFVSQNGILYNKEKTRIILVPEGIAGAVSIANSVTEISGDYLFRNCGLITSIIIPASVAKIDNVFWWCSSLESITVSADNTVYASQDGILYNKEKTELILAPKAIKGAVVIPSGVTTISGYAFSGCSLLTSVTIPSSVETIKFGAFSGCDSLASMTLSLETEFIDSYNRVSNKFGCIFGGTGFGDWGENGAVPSSLKTIVISGGCNILDQMFYNCREITSVTISNSVTFIGYEAFSGCINLAEINGANNVATIMDGAFANTAFLNSMLNQSDDIVYWGTKLFMAKSDITECAIEDGTTSIMPHAFKGSSLTSITIPASVVSIGMSAFADCKDLQTITFEPDSQLETVGGYAFSGCSALRTVVIPEGVTVIWVGTFEGCTSLQTVGAPIDGITYIPSSISKLTITNGETIEAGALSAFYNLTELIIGEGVQKLEPGALRGLGALQKLTLQNMGHTLGQLFGTENFNGAVKINQIISYSGQYGEQATLSGDLYVPSSLTHVTVLGSLYRVGAFSYCANLTDIAIYSKTSIIPHYTFYGCTALRTLVLPSEQSYYIDHFAIIDCESLEKIFYTGTTGIWSFPQAPVLKADVSVYGSNDDISDKVYFYSQSKPNGSGRYWHYDEDEKTPIVWAEQE